MNRQRRDALGAEAFDRYLTADYLAAQADNETERCYWERQARTEWAVALQWWELAARQAA